MNERRKNIALLLAVTLLSALSAACAPPTVKLKVSRDEVKPGDPVTVSWESKNAKNVELNGQSVEKIGARTVTPDQTTEYQVIAKRGKKEARDSATVTVNRTTAAAPRITLKAEPSAIEHGQNATLTWESENARSVTIPGLGELSTAGTREVSPRVSTTYTATAVGEGGTSTASARVTVTDPAQSERPRTVDPENDPGTVAAAAAEFARVMPKVFFELDRSDLRPSEQEKLRRAADWLQREANRSISFRIEGNCDPRGTAEYNLGLGDRRAQAVRDFLISLGIDANRIDVVSYGLERATGTSEGSAVAPPSWAFDRRADLVYQRGGQPR